MGRAYPEPAAIRGERAARRAHARARGLKLDYVTNQVSVDSECQLRVAHLSLSNQIVQLLCVIIITLSDVPHLFL